MSGTSTFLHRLLGEHNEARARGSHITVSVMLVNGPALGGKIVEATSEYLVLQASDTRVVCCRTEALISYIIKQ